MKEMIAADPRTRNYSFKEKHEEYKNNLAQWVSKQLDKFDENTEFQSKMLKKYTRRETFSSLLIRKAKKKFFAALEIDAEQNS